MARRARPIFAMIWSAVAVHKDRVSVLIVVFDVSVNCLLQVFHGGESAAADSLISQVSKEALDDVEPRTTRRNEVHVESGMALEPALDSMNGSARAKTARISSSQVEKCSDTAFLLLVEALMIRRTRRRVKKASRADSTSRRNYAVNGADRAALTNKPVRKGKFCRPESAQPDRPQKGPLRGRPPGTADRG